MKLFTTFSLCIYSAFIPLFIFADQASIDLKRTSSELAASLVIAKLDERISETPVNDALLYSAMTNSPAANSDPEKAKENMSAVFKNDVRSRYEDEALKLLDRLALPDSRTNVFTSAFLANATNTPTEVIEKATKNSFESTFATARKQVCEEQAIRLSESVRPTESEIETLPREKLAEIMTDRIANTQRESVYQENYKIISEKIVAPMLDGAFRQRNEQIDIVKKKPVGGVAPSVISSNLLRAVTAHIDTLRKDDAVYVYGIFPSVTNELIAATADKRTRGFFREGIAAAEMTLDPAEILRTIEEDPETHRRFATSFKAFEPDLKTNFVAQAVTSALKDVNVAEANEFSEFIRAHIGDSDMQAAVTARVKKDLQPLLIEVRGKASDLQFEKLFPTLSSGAWFPEPPFVDRIFLNADFKKALVQWKDIPELADFAEICKKQIVMEETENKIDKALVDGMEIGGAAREKQHKITDESFKDVKKSFKDKHPTFDDVVAEYSKTVLETWVKVRKDTLKIQEGVPDDGRYSALFPSTEEKIRQLARELFDLLEKEAAKKDDPEPEDTPPPPPEELEEIEMDCVYIFDRKGDDIKGTLVINGKDVDSFTCPHSPQEFKKDVATFTTALRASLTDTLKEAVKSNRIKLTIQIDVRDSLIYYGAVSGVSTKVKRDAKTFGEYITSVELTEAE